MKIYPYLFLIIIISSCKKDTIEDPVFQEKYGKGMYVVTNLGINYLDYTITNANVQKNIFENVNNISIMNPKSIKINGNKGYIIGNRLYIVDIKTFALLGEVNGFYNAVKCDIISHNRAFVIDRGESLVKIVDLDNFEITGKIEVGDSTKPSFIISNDYKAFILNGGGQNYEKRDSTIISIDFKDRAIPISEVTGTLKLDFNPTSAIWIYNPKILCKGIYNTNDPTNDTESSFFDISGFDNKIINNKTLTGVYNANNLIPNNDGSLSYFTASDGIYQINNTTLNYNRILTNEASILQINFENYQINDSTTYPVGMLYMNDINNSNKIYKYNLFENTFQDTINIEGEILDIQFKN